MGDEGPSMVECWWSDVHDLVGYKCTEAALRRWILYEYHAHDVCMYVNGVSADSG